MMGVQTDSISFICNLYDTTYVKQTVDTNPIRNVLTSTPYQLDIPTIQINDLSGYKTRIDQIGYNKHTVNTTMYDTFYTGKTSTLFNYGNSNPKPVFNTKDISNNVNSIIYKPPVIIYKEANICNSVTKKTYLGETLEWNISEIQLDTFLATFSYTMVSNSQSTINAVDGEAAKDTIPNSNDITNYYLAPRGWKVLAWVSKSTGTSSDIIQANNYILLHQILPGDIKVGNVFKLDDSSKLLKYTAPNKDMVPYPINLVNTKNYKINKIKFIITDSAQSVNLYASLSERLRDFNHYGSMNWFYVDIKQLTITYNNPILNLFFVYFPQNDHLNQIDMLFDISLCSIRH
jgi:hypothetical protein